MNTQETPATGASAGHAEPIRPMPRGVRRLAWGAGVPIVVAMTLGSYLLSFTGLYWSLQVAAHFAPPFAGIAAVVLDLFISICLLGDLLLKWAGLSSAVPATAAWLVTSLSVAANFYAGYAALGIPLSAPAPDPAARPIGNLGWASHWVGGVLHGAFPLLFVAIVEVGQMTIARWAKLRAPRDITKKQNRERVSRSRLMRWLMDPPGTLIMTRLRHMWLIYDESEALELMRARKLAIARLRDQYGRIGGIRVPLLWRVRSPLEKKWAVTTGRLDGGKGALSRVADTATREMFSPAGPQPRPSGDGYPARAQPAHAAVRTGERPSAGSTGSAAKQAPTYPGPTATHGPGPAAASMPETTTARKQAHWPAELETLYSDYAERLRDGDAATEMTGNEIAQRLGKDPGHARNIRKRLRARYSDETGVQFIVEGGKLRRLEMPSEPEPVVGPDAGRGRPRREVDGAQDGENGGEGDSARAATHAHPNGASFNPLPATADDDHASGCGDDHELSAPRPEARGCAPASHKGRWLRTPG